MYSQSSQMDRSYPVFRSLNAARVCAEFCVVHYHLTFLYQDGGLLSNSEVADNLMSFFFVLSGFVAMHSNRDVDFSQLAPKLDFITRRFTKVYPTYLIWFLLDVPGTIVSGWATATHCWLFWLSLASQPLLLHPWLGCQHISISNGVGWYLCTLFWLWILFPFLNLRRFLEASPWLKISFLYLLSLSIWALLAPFHASYLRAVPVLRLPEFLMGCCVAFTIPSPHSPHWIPLLCLALFLAYCSTVHALPALWPGEDLHSVCTLWPLRSTTTYYPTVFLSKFSPIWCLIIHSLAASELTDSNLLPFDFLASLNTFSLQTYLSHYTVARGIQSLSNILHVFHWWSIDVLILACYSVAYSYSILESRLFAWAKRIQPPSPPADLIASP
jgi:peptidoglycan/LPS O-acetylase OafA/YrhL